VVQRPAATTPFIVTAWTSARRFLFDDEPTLETIWQRISTYVGFPSEVSRRVAQKVCEGQGLYDEQYDRAPLWVVALAVCWAGSTVWTTAYHHVSIVDLFDRVHLDEELQRVVSAAWRAHASPFEILTMIHTWKGNEDG
jgi:hypothetical protein